MTRPAKVPAATHRPAAAIGDTQGPIAAPGGPEALAQAREWVQGSLDTARAAAGWMEALQRISLQIASSWNENLAQASRQAGQADDPYALMAVPAQVAKLQLEALSRQVATGLQDLFDHQVALVSQANDRATDALGRLAAPEGLAPRRGADAADAADRTGAPLAAWGHAQDEWLAVTQRWIDAMDAATRRRNGRPT